MANPIKGASNFLNGVFGQGSGVDRQIVELDPGTLKNIEDQTTQAARPVEEFNKELGQGVGEQGFMQTSAQPDPYFGEALRQKYRTMARQDLDNIRLQNETQAKFRKSQQIQKSFKMQLARQNVATANYEAMAKANMEAEIARSQVLVNVLGIGGRIGGMYAGGYFDQKKNNEPSGFEGWQTQEPIGPSEMGQQSSVPMPSSMARNRR